MKGTDFFLSDDAEWVRYQVGDEVMDPTARVEFLLSGYVAGRDTLFPNVRQVQAGEFIIVNEQEGQYQIGAHRYYTFGLGRSKWTSSLSYEEEFDAVVEHSVRRLVEYADGSQIVVPLSGGFDSRLIALMLKRLDYNNVITYTYGSASSPEVKQSGKIASSLGLDWQFVEYTPEIWRAAWQSDERKRYQRWASGWSSLPHIQDWLAIHILHEKGDIDTDCVIVPGHGAMAVLSHLPGVPHDRNLGKIMDAVWSKKYRLSVVNGESAAKVKEKIYALTNREYDNDYDSGLSIFAFFEWAERQSKFLANSVRVYEFYGYNWWMPLWDRSFISLWDALPPIMHSDKSWYKETVYNLYENSVDDGAGVGRNDESKSRIRNRVRLYLARSWMNPILRRITPYRYGINNPYSSEGRYPEAEVRSLWRKGYRRNGIAAHFFLKDASPSNSQ